MRNLHVDLDNACHRWSIALPAHCFGSSLASQVLDCPRSVPPASEPFGLFSLNESTMFLENMLEYWDLIFEVDSFLLTHSFPLHSRQDQLQHNSLSALLVFRMRALMQFCNEFRVQSELGFSLTWESVSAPSNMSHNALAFAYSSADWLLPGGLIVDTFRVVHLNSLFCTRILGMWPDHPYLSSGTCSLSSLFDLPSELAYTLEEFMEYSQRTPGTVSTPCKVFMSGGRADETRVGTLEVRAFASPSTGLAQWKGVFVFVEAPTQSDHIGSQIAQWKEAQSRSQQLAAEGDSES